MRTKHTAALSGGFVFAGVIASLLVGPELPETMVTHWDATGRPDGSMATVWGQFLLPTVTAAVVVVLLAVPRIDPTRPHFESFRGIYNDFVAVLVAFLTGVHGFVLAVNLGYDLPITAVVSFGVGLLIVFSGFLLERADQNWFVGIRTPWTLSDEAVWDRTHELAGPLFKLAGLVTLGGVLVPRYATALVIGPVLTVSLLLFAYSYYLFDRDAGTDVASN